MKGMMKGIMGVLVLTVVMIGTTWASETTEEKSLSKEAAQINRTAGSSQGETVVVGRLEKEFGVTEAQIQGLRDQKMGYGEISIVYSIASKMPGGITDANIQQIMTERQGSPRMGWGEVCNKLGIKLGPTVSQMSAMNRELHGDMMRADKEAGAMGQERNTEQHREMMGNGSMGGMGGGGGMSHGKFR